MLTFAFSVYWEVFVIKKIRTYIFYSHVGRVIFNVKWYTDSFTERAYLVKFASKFYTAYSLMQLLINTTFDISVTSFFDSTENTHCLQTFSSD